MTDWKNLARFFLFPLIVVFMSVSLPTSGDARIRGGGSVPVAAPFCDPELTDIEDSCADSPGGSDQVANFFSDGTGVSLAARPPWNVTCVDYKCGVPETARFVTDPTIGGPICTVSTLVDPAVALTNVSGSPSCGTMDPLCTYMVDTIGSISAPRIYCTGAGAVDLRGLDLGPVGGHLSTFVEFNSNITGSTLAFNKFKADESTYVRNSFGAWGSGSQGDIILHANSQYGDWDDSWSAQGDGTGSQSGNTMTISACSVCEFRVGQYAGFASVGLGNNAIIAQLTGTPGGVGTYQMSASGTRSSQQVTSGFRMAGGMPCNTSGDVKTTYNFFSQINGRVGTCSQRGIGGTATNIGEVSNKWNFSTACVRIFNISHYEIIEYVIQDGNRPIQWDNFINTGNVQYYPLDCAASSTTGTNFVATGAINGTIDPAFTLTYDNVNTSYNVIVSERSTEGSAALDYIAGGGAGTSPVQVNSYTAIENYIYKGPSSYFSLGSGQQEAGVTSFWNGSQSGTTLTVSSFGGGKDIEVGDRVWETGVKITGLGTGTGQTGTYTMETPCSTSCGSGARRSGPDVITSVTASGNVDMATGSTLTLPQYLSSQSNSSPFLYPGMR